MVTEMFHTKRSIKHRVARCVVQVRESLSRVCVHMMLVFEHGREQHDFVTSCKDPKFNKNNPAHMRANHLVQDGKAMLWHSKMMLKTGEVLDATIHFDREEQNQ